VLCLSVQTTDQALMCVSVIDNKYIATCRTTEVGLSLMFLRSSYYTVAGRRCSTQSHTRDDSMYSLLQINVDINAKHNEQY